MPKDIADDILSLKEKGEKWLDEFKAGCFEDAQRFEKPIPRRKSKSFASAAVPVRLPSKDRKIKELQGTRDLFGRLLYLATVMDINLHTVFAYPLTPVPMSLAHVDGSVMKTDKSKLMKKLEEHIISEAPASVDAFIVDAMFLIQSLTICLQPSAE